MPKVETFEQNIASEIKRKEASLTEISAASNNVGNDPVDLPKKQPIFLMALVGFFVICLLGFGFIGYVALNKKTSSAAIPEQPVIPVTTTVASGLQNISPTLSGQIGRFVTSVDKKDAGYVITISDYSSVFAYMTRNETSYIDELALLFAGSSYVEATTTPPQSNTSTSTASSTQPLATTTEKSIDTTQQGQLTRSDFYDITISNQNMRVWSKDNNHVVYAFVGNNYLLISQTKEGILALRSDILR